MLILTRKPNQTIRIADNVEVTVLSVKSGQVRIGISAPRNIPVHRSEIYLRIKAGAKDNSIVVDDAVKQSVDSQ